MRLSFVTTVFNEERTIGSLLKSLSVQSVIPNEVIIVDGGSTDKTVQIIKDNIKRYKKLNMKLVEKKGNRSVCRNEGINKSLGNIVLLSDAGNILDKNWVKNISKPFMDKDVDAVAGYYKGVANNYFQKSLVPYVLVMPDKINEQDFLPSTRSMAIRKSVWRKIGKFNENLSHNEDFELANRLKSTHAKIIFAKDAIANWIPRTNLKQAFIMFFRFALGDIQANLLREKVIYIYLRYLLALYLLFIALVFHSFEFWIFYIFLLACYFIWSVSKNYKYVNNIRAFLYLPLLQITSDISVMLGSTIGFLQRISFKSLGKIILRNKGLLIVLIAYIITMLSVIEWGIPNANHPFNYHMDEWHFAQALRAFIKYGTGSVSGAASIPLYHIVSSLIFLIPFYILGIINPFAIRSSVTNLQMQHVFFEVLRLHTVFYGVISIWVLYLILKKFVRYLPLIFVSIFAFTPIWIFLSNFYKYDITLNFWIITTLYFIFKFSKTKNINNFLFACIACGLALSTKFSAAPLLIGLILSYFIYANNIRLRELCLGIFTAIFIFCVIGIPDLIFGKGSYSQLLYSTLVQGPQATTAYNLAMPGWLFLIIKEYPSTFGLFLILLTYLSLLYWTLLFIKSSLKRKLKIYRDQLFVYSIFVIFLLISLSFNLDGGGNRSLVLLPFMILLSAFTIKDLVKKHSNLRFIKSMSVIILIVILIFQIMASYAWTSIKLQTDIRNTASEWIIKNIKPNQEIGIENIPIYQNLPNFILKEFYLKEYGKISATRYKYIIVSAQTITFPKTIIVTQDYDDVNYLNTSPKKDLVRRLKMEKYKKIIVFSPDLRYYDLFADRITFILMYPVPLTISIYEK